MYFRFLKYETRRNRQEQTWTCTLGVVAGCLDEDFSTWRNVRGANTRAIEMGIAAINGHVRSRNVIWQPLSIVAADANKIKQR